MTSPPVPSGVRVEPDVVLADRYRLIAEIGRGASGHVWRAEDRRLGREVALKLLDPTRLADDRTRERFRREALATARIGHAHVARLYDVAEHDGRVFLVMELVDGPPLSALLTGGRRLPDAATAAVGVQLAEGLHAAHVEGFVHRDVKPANVLIRPDGGLALIDFGVARLLDSGTVTSEDVTVGTARYVAPEQIAGEPAGPAADLYALGLLLWECVAGRPAFEGDTVHAVALARLTRDPRRLPEADPMLAEAIARATRRDPVQRFGSAADLADALRPLAGPRPSLVTRAILRQDGRIGHV